MNKPNKEWEKEFDKQFAERWLNGGIEEEVKQFIHSEREKVKKEVVEDIHPRLYALWANIDFVHNASARKQAKELLDYLSKLK